MSFVSFSFLFLFVITLGIRLTIGRDKLEPVYLIAPICASTIFYSWHIPAYLSLLLGSTLVERRSGLRMLFEHHEPDAGVGRLEIHRRSRRGLIRSRRPDR